MIGRERFRAILQGGPADRIGYWSGALDNQTSHEFMRRTGVESEIDLSIAIGDDVTWIPAAVDGNSHPSDSIPCPSENRADAALPKGSLASASRIADVEAYPWPESPSLDFSQAERMTVEAHRKGLAVFGGPRISIPGLLAHLFGIEELARKATTCPAVVEAAVERISELCAFVFGAFFEQTKELPEAILFCHEPVGVETIPIWPGGCRDRLRRALGRIVQIAGSGGVPVVLRSRNELPALVPEVIEAGVAGLQMLRPLDAGIGDQHVARCRERLAFIGGVDPRILQAGCREADVATEVDRLRRLMGERLVVSAGLVVLPSSVPLESLLALRQATVTRPHWSVLKAASQCEALSDRGSQPGDERCRTQIFPAWGSGWLFEPSLEAAAPAGVDRFSQATFFESSRRPGT